MPPEEGWGNRKGGGIIERPSHLLTDIDDEEQTGRGSVSDDVVESSNGSDPASWTIENVPVNDSGDDPETGLNNIRIVRQKNSDRLEAEAENQVIQARMSEVAPEIPREVTPKTLPEPTVISEGVLVVPEEVKLEKKEKAGDGVNQVEDILLALKFIPAGRVAESKGQSWFDATLSRKMKAVERMKQRGEKITGLMSSDGNFSKEDSGELLNGIYYLGSAELRETRPDDWKEIKGYLESKYGLETDKIIVELDKLYVEGGAAETSLQRIISDNKLEGLVEPLKLVRGYMESGQYPKGWGEAKRVFEEAGIKVGSYERMREIERKKKMLDETIFGKRETSEQAEEKVEAVDLAPDDHKEEREKAEILDVLTRFYNLDDKEEREAYLSSLADRGIKMREFLEDMEKAVPGRSKDVMRQLRAVVEVWRMSEERKQEFPTMTKIASNYARVLGLE